jgi:hypothetical protein
LDKVMSRDINAIPLAEFARMTAEGAGPPSAELVEFLATILGPAHQRLVERRRRERRA